MLSLLADGRPHTRQELQMLLWDEFGDLKNICPHLSRLRKHVRPQGREIICELARRRICYRLVQLVE